MATLFITSSPTGPLDGSRPVVGFDKMNGFVDRLKAVWKDDSRCLIISASPDAYGQNDEMTDFFRNALLTDGFSLATFDLLDRRYDDMSREQFQGYDVILLGGGHVPTQNKFFHDIGLREKLAGFSGIVIGISAGSMNLADEVYCIPEEAGEAADTEFKKFIEGLGLTKIKILPHYQMVKNNILDGFRLYSDIAIPDSKGQKFYSLCDGSYVMEKDGKAVIYGECWISDNQMFYKLCDTDESVEI